MYFIIYEGSIYGTQGGGFNFSPLHQDQLLQQPQPLQQLQPTMTGSCVPEMLLAANNNSNIDSTSNNLLDINNTLATFFTGKCNVLQ